MNDEIKILEMMKEKRDREYSTSDIVEHLYEKEYKEIAKGPVFNDKEKLLELKRKKAQLHRKVLYHLNKLVEDQIIKVNKVAGKGQKYFALALGTDEDLVIDHGMKRKKIIISKPSLPAMPIEGYEQKNLIKKYEESTWINRVNSCLIQCRRFENLDKLREIVKESFSYINDTLALNNFETMVDKSSSQDLTNFLDHLEKEASDYGKTVSIIIDFSNIKDDDKIEGLAGIFSKLKPSSMNMIFDMSSKQLQKHEVMMENIVKVFSSAKVQVHIKNQDCHDAPYILGKAGPYTFSPDEWNYFREEYGSKVMCIVCGQSTISIDVEEFFEMSRSSYHFRELILNIAKSLLYTNSMQRSRSSEYFKYFMDLNSPVRSNLFSYSRNYIRFWNYGWKEQKLDPQIVLDLMKSTKESTDDFCISEETIYKACGMPTRFKIGFSCAFKEMNKEEFSEEKFRKLQIRKLEDLYSENIKKLIFEKEELFRLFDGGDRLRFYRSGDNTPKEIVREINVIINNYKIPFFCYDFGEMKGANLMLTSFIK